MVAEMSLMDKMFNNQLSTVCTAFEFVHFTTPFGDERVGEILTQTQDSSYSPSRVSDI